METASTPPSANQAQSLELSGYWALAVGSVVLAALVREGIRSVHLPPAIARLRRRTSAPDALVAGFLLREGVRWLGARVLRPPVA
jgi:hypothetical protein